MPNIVGIQFKEVGKIYYFSPGETDFQKGEGVIVETARGVEYGTVVIPNKDVSDSEVKGQLKPVVRKATDKDREQYIANTEKRVKALKDAQEKIAKHNLDMKLVDAEFTFDGSKVVFYFTSENRVDFRDLVKDLASMFHLRIELRQIGIRDECKLKGGLGPCGRACCCNAYMGDFERVSIKMAKNQGLSLNPTKISGLCGRLMCCLKFEDAHYAETLKFMPKIGSEINTPDGKGLVESTDMLKRRVKARVILKDGLAEVREYNAEELGIKFPCENCDASTQHDTEEVPAEEE